MQYTTLLVVATFIAVYVGMTLGRWPVSRSIAPASPCLGPSFSTPLASSPTPLC